MLRFHRTVFSDVELLEPVQLIAGIRPCQNFAGKIRRAEAANGLMESRCASNEGRKHMLLPAFFKVHCLADVDEALRFAPVQVNDACHEFTTNVTPFVLAPWRCLRPDVLMEKEFTFLLAGLSRTALLRRQGAQ